MPPFDLMRAIARGTQTVDTMPIPELERRASHALALLEQAEDLLPGVVRLDVELDRSPSRADDTDWIERRAMLQRLAKRAAQLGARLTDAAWRMEQQAQEDLLAASGPHAGHYGLRATGS